MTVIALARLLARGYPRHDKFDAARLFHFASSSGLFPPLQLESEFVPFLTLLHEARPANILEIGTHRGGSLFLFCRILAPSGHILSIDLPGGPFGGGYPLWKSPLYRSFAWGDQRMSLLRSDSHSPETAESIMKLLAGNPLDLLFIDGDHTFEGVRSDFEVYSPLVKPGGMVAFHDIVEGPMAGGVHRFWLGLRDRYRHKEFVENWSQGSCGLGLLWKDADV